jgi:hypothetical protein
MPRRRNFKINKQNKKKKKRRRNRGPVLKGSVNSRYLAKMMKEGTPVGSTEWTHRRKIEYEIRYIKAAQEKRNSVEKAAKNRVPKAPKNW